MIDFALDEGSVVRDLAFLYSGADGSRSRADGRVRKCLLDKDGGSMLVSGLA